MSHPYGEISGGVAVCMVGGGDPEVCVEVSAYSSTAGVPVQQVSPRRVSGKAVSHTHAPDVLYGPQGQ